MEDNSKIGGLFQDRIARLLILGAFVLIGAILLIHVFSTSYILQHYSLNSTATSDIFRDVNSANTNIFNIILALFGAWVGAVLAFYFGSQSVDKAYSSLKQAQQSISNIVSDNKLSGITVKQLIERNPDSTRLNKFNMSSKIKDIMKTVGDIFPFVMVLDNDDKKVLGLLFISDLTGAKSKSELMDLDKSLKDYLKENDVNDFITKTKWSESGVSNFATVNMSDTLKDVVDAMNNISSSLSVRAIVIENDVSKAIIGHDHISKEINK
jgi:hypothetical protein